MAGGSVTKQLLLLFKADGTQAIQSLELVKMSLSGIVDPISNITESMMRMGTEFETRMANVNTLINVSKQELSGYSDQIMDMSLRVPQSAAQLADAVYQGLSAGIPKEEVMAFTEVASKAATAGMTDTYTAVDAMTSVLNAYGLQARDATKVSDLMFQTVKDGKINYEQLAGKIGMVAPAAKAAGVPIEQMFAAISTTTGQLGPEQSITGISAAITELNTSGSKAEKALKKLGFENLQAALKTNTLQGVMEKLNKSGVKTNDIFGVEAARAANILGGSYEIAGKQLENSMNSAGASADAYAVIEETLEVKLQKRKNAQDVLAIQIAQQLEPAEKAWVDVQTKLLGVLAQSPASIKQVAGVALGFANIAGKAATGATQLASGTLAATQMFDKFAKMGGVAGKAANLLTNNIGKLAGGLGAATLAFVAVNAALDYYEKKVKELDELRGGEDTTESLTRKIKALEKAQEDLNSKAAVTKETNKELIKLFNLDLSDNTTIEALNIVNTQLNGLRKTLDKVSEAEKKTNEQGKDNNGKRDNKDQDEINKQRIEAAQKLLESEMSLQKQRNADNLFALRELELQELETEKQRALNQAKSAQERNLIELTFENDRLKIIESYDVKIQDAILKNIEEGQKKEEEANEKRKEMQDKALADAQAYSDEYGFIWQGIGSLPADAIRGGKEGLRAALKEILIQSLDYIEKQLIAAEVGAMAQGIMTGGLSLASSLPKLAAIKGLMEIAKASVASFDVGGIPRVAGMGMLHPGDVIVNPTSDNAMMEMLTDKLAAKINGQGARFVLELDGRTVAVNSVKHINDMNRGLPSGRGVFDQSREN